MLMEKLPSNEKGPVCVQQYPLWLSMRAWITVKIPQEPVDMGLDRLGCVSVEKEL